MVEVVAYGKVYQPLMGVALAKLALPPLGGLSLMPSEADAGRVLTELQVMGEPEAPSPYWMRRMDPPSFALGTQSQKIHINDSTVHSRSDMKI